MVILGKFFWEENPENPGAFPLQLHEGNVTSKAKFFNLKKEARPYRFAQVVVLMRVGAFVRNVEKQRFTMRQPAGTTASSCVQPILECLIELVFLLQCPVVSPNERSPDSSLGFRLALNQKSIVLSVFSILTERWRVFLGFFQTLSLQCLTDILCLYLTDSGLMEKKKGFFGEKIIDGYFVFCEKSKRICE